MVEIICLTILRWHVMMRPSNANCFDGRNGWWEGIFLSLQSQSLRMEPVVYERTQGLQSSGLMILSNREVHEESIGKLREASPFTNAAFQFRESGQK